MMDQYKELWYDWMGGNDVLFLGINGIRPGENYDALMKMVSWLGAHERFPMYVGIIAVYAVISIAYKFITKQRGIWFFATMWLGIFLVLGSGYALTALTTDQMKDHFSYPRPYVALSSTGQVHKLEATEPNDDFRSFPSGHVSFSTFMLVALAPVLNGFFTTAFMAYVLILAWSRISLGVHFPMDVVFSIIYVVPMIILLRTVLYTILRVVFKIKC